MNTRVFKSFAAIIALGVLGGCGAESPDPLMFDDQGALRCEVTSEEVEEAQIPDCDEIDIDIDEELDVNEVPITGNEEPEILIGVGGFALCVEDGEPTLDDINVGDEIGPDGTTTLSIDGLDEEDAEQVSTVTDFPESQQQGMPGRNPTIVYDPTPQPAAD